MKSIFSKPSWKTKEKKSSDVDPPVHKRIRKFFSYTIARSNSQPKEDTSPNPHRLQRSSGDSACLTTLPWLEAPAPPRPFRPPPNENIKPFSRSVSAPLTKSSSYSPWTSNQILPESDDDWEEYMNSVQVDMDELQSVYRADHIKPRLVRHHPTASKSTPSLPFIPITTSNETDDRLLSLFPAPPGPAPLVIRKRNAPKPIKILPFQSFGQTTCCSSPSLSATPSLNTSISGSSMSTPCITPPASPMDTFNFRLPVIPNADRKCPPLRLTHSSSHLRESHTAGVHRPTSSDVISGRIRQVGGTKKQVSPLIYYDQSEENLVQWGYAV